MQAKAECKASRYKSLSEDVGIYYGWKARIEAIEEYAEGKASTWDLNKEKAELEEAYKDGALDIDVSKSGEGEEVQSKETIDLVEGLGENKGKGDAVITSDA